MERILSMFATHPTTFFTTKNHVLHTTFPKTPSKLPKKRQNLLAMPPKKNLGKPPGLGLQNGLEEHTGKDDSSGSTR
jgi:hypothetical protein